MDHLTRLQRAVDYIEAHLKRDLPTERIAREACFSMWHFQRIFSAAVGLGVKEYVRRRRLTQAMLELAGTKRGILQIALDYQFESQEAFTRAFKATFGITPGMCRRKKIASQLARSKPRITPEYLAHLYGDMTMVPTFIDLPEKKVVGLGTAFISAMSPDKNNMNKIPPLWHAFTNRTAEIQNKIGEASYGLVEMLPKAAKTHKDELFYIACTEVSDFGTLAAGMESRTLPAGKYARFTHVGKLDRLPHTMDYIYGSWLPKSGVELRPAPHVEVYDSRFDITSDTSEFDILLPVA